MTHLLYLACSPQTLHPKWIKMENKELQALLEENKKTQDPFIDLGNLGLTEFPMDVLEHEWLEYLNLGFEYLAENKWEKSSNKGRSNQIEKIPIEIARLSKLVTLGLEENRVKDYSFLKSLPRLKGLLLGFCQLGAIDFLASWGGGAYYT